MPSITRTGILALALAITYTETARVSARRIHRNHGQVERDNFNRSYGPEVPEYELDDLACIEYYEEDWFVQQVKKASVADDPCMTCADIIMMDQNFESPTMPEEVCLAGYRSKYCTFGTFTCMKGPSEPDFCQQAYKGEGNAHSGWKIENICQRKRDDSVDLDARTQTQVAEHKKQIQAVLGDGKLTKGLASESTKTGHACLQHSSETSCNTAPEGCIYYPSLRTEPDKRQDLLKALGLTGADSNLLDLQFSWNTGCVPRQADVPAVKDSSKVKLRWADDTCFLNSALFSLFGQFDDLIPSLATKPFQEADGCGEFIRSGVRNVVARMRTAESVNYERFVGLLRKGLPVACPQYMQFQGMQEIATSGTGNYRSALRVLFMAMGFKITPAEIRRGIEAYKARFAKSSTPEASAKLSFQYDFSYRLKEVTVVDELTLADGNLFQDNVYGSALVLQAGKKGLKGMYGFRLEPVLKAGKCAKSFSACIVASFTDLGYSLVFPPKFLIFAVDLLPDERRTVHENDYMPKDFGTGFALPPAILEGCDGCKTPTYSLRAFGAGTEGHQTAFSRGGTLKSGWIYHNDMGHKYVWAQEQELSASQPYDVGSPGEGLRASSTTLLYQIDVGAFGH